MEAGKRGRSKAERGGRERERVTKITVSTHTYMYNTNSKAEARLPVYLLQYIILPIGNSLIVESQLVRVLRVRKRTAQRGELGDNLPLPTEHPLRVDVPVIIAVPNYTPDLSKFSGEQMSCYLFARCKCMAFLLAR